jgi:hypothetical protein
MIDSFKTNGSSPPAKVQSTRGNVTGYSAGVLTLSWTAAWRGRLAGLRLRAGIAPSC